MNQKHASRILIWLGFLLSLGAAGFAGVNAHEAVEASGCAEHVLLQMEDRIPETVIPATEYNSQIESLPEPLRDMKELEVDGISYVGILEIPALELILPVASHWSESNGKKAPCRFSGSVYQDDMILCAHNYRSHFGRLKSLSEGDYLTFTDVEGYSFPYEVISFEVLDGVSVEEMAYGAWDLTLFTCTSDGKARFTVRCKRC